MTHNTPKCEFYRVGACLYMREPASVTRQPSSLARTSMLIESVAVYRSAARGRDGKPYRWRRASNLLCYELNTGSVNSIDYRDDALCNPGLGTQHLS